MTTRSIGFGPSSGRATRKGSARSGQSGGFDVVIGNPPYFNIDSTYGAHHPVPAYLSRAYPQVYTDRKTLMFYYYFLAKAISLASQRVGFIVSQAFMAADKARLGSAASAYQ